MKKTIFIKPFINLLIIQAQEQAIRIPQKNLIILPKINSNVNMMDELVGQNRQKTNLNNPPKKAGKKRKNN